MKKIAVIIFAIFLSLMSCSFVCSAAVPYNNYIYSESDTSLMVAPQAYLSDNIITGESLGIAPFKTPTDVFCDSDSKIYILDSENDRIVVLNSEAKLLKEITFEVTGAKGLFVNDSGIYIADTANHRIVVLSKDGELLKILDAPKSDVLSDDFIYKPIKLVVDRDGLLYVVSEGTYEGILNIDADGNFIGFFGVNNVSSSVWDMFWRRFSTREQRKNMLQLVPQDFSSIDLDADGFFLATTYTADNNSMVKRLNPGGNNVIRSKSKTGILGDPSRIYEGSLAGVSSFIDVAAGPQETYACLDITRGRIFCYDNNGYLLYSFGTLADQVGGFSKPIALTYVNDNIVVLDSTKNSLTLFTPTKYASLLNEGIYYKNDLQYQKAADCWNEVLKINSNCDLALNELGQALYNSGEYEQALEYFKKTDNKEMYSNTKKEIRSNFIYQNIYWIAFVVILLIALVYLIPVIRKRRGKGKNV